ncbi:ABC transporter ATP-binding protein [Empedobacter tilapiae]|uniref:ATP-binding cassette domain-containing protein n=1 Tax=Empedobacter tilapiae TaxID=2491114 RepID=A0A4Z1BJY7_9FLAO|nr:ATP-binding cassette domain-containing protein [Empedobacter tilapiae]TGN24262.1 ATP-binding cassette domain-containing protein [Empedobacter tilapiae]
MIEIKEIEKQYGNQKVLQDINLTLPKNQLISLIGPNGAGKSTLLSIASRLLHQDKGTVILEDKLLTDFKSNALAKQLAILKQSNHMELRLTIEDLVAFGRFPYSKGKLTALDQEKINDALVFCSLEDIKTKFLDELSGGQKQRAFLAMIIAQDTDYIFLDEPLNNLDMKLSVQIMQMLKRLVLEKKKTIVIVIHEINFAANYSDYIVGMKNGKIFNQGKALEVITTKNLENLFDMKFEIIEYNGTKICNYFK